MPDDKTPKPSFLDDQIAQREAMFDKMYPRPEEKPGATDPKVIQEIQPTPPPPTPQPSEVPPVTPEPAAPPAAPEPKPVSPGDESKEKKTVPLEALHEARKEIQMYKKEVTELKEQVKVLLADIKELHQKPPETPEAPLDGTDYDKELATLRKKIADFEEREKQRDSLSKEAQQKLAQDKLYADLNSVNTALEAEGAFGFKDMLPLISDELHRISRDNPDEAKALDNPEGWKKIFKETILPRVEGVASKRPAAQKKVEKENLKDGVALLTPSVAPQNPKASDKDDEWTFDKYMEARRNRSPQTQLATR